MPDEAGLYEIDQMEMAGGLELRPDGRFRYGLDYGEVYRNLRFVGVLKPEVYGASLEPEEAVEA